MATEPRLDAWGPLTELAKDLRCVIDAVLRRYDESSLEGLGLVMRLDGKEVRLKHQERYSPASYGGVLRIDDMKKIEVKKRSQDVLDESGKYIYDLHKRIR